MVVAVVSVTMTDENVAVMPPPAPPDGMAKTLDMCVVTNVEMYCVIPVDTMVMVDVGVVVPIGVLVVMTKTPDSLRSTDKGGFGVVAGDVEIPWRGPLRIVGVASS